MLEAKQASVCCAESLLDLGCIRYGKEGQGLCCQNGKATYASTSLRNASRPIICRHDTLL